MSRRTKRALKRKFKEFMRALITLLAFSGFMFTAPALKLHQPLITAVCIISGITLMFMLYADDWRRYWRG